MLDRYAVLGHPVAHSQSPFIHQAFAEQTGQALFYGRQECAPGQFVQTVRAWVGSPGDAGMGPVRGCNVTIPFKFEAIDLAASVSPRARLAGAANVLCFDSPGWSADNTDGAGLVRDLLHNEGLTLKGARILLLGAGGAAAGVLGPLLAEQPHSLVVSNRSAEKAVTLVQRHGEAAQQAGTVLQALPAEALATVERFDLVINATATSLVGATPLAPPQALRPGCCAVDLMYGSAAQGFLDWARAHGAAHTADGLGMLVEQAALAFAFWRGVQPDTAPVLRALRKRLAAPPAPQRGTP